MADPKTQRDAVTNTFWSAVAAEDLTPCCRLRPFTLFRVTHNPSLNVLQGVLTLQDHILTGGYYV